MSKNNDNPEADEDDESGGGSGIASKIIIGFAKEMGWEEIAEITAKWPQLIGKSTAKVTKKILAYKAEEKPVPPEVEAEAEKAFQDDEQATLLLGPLLARNYEIGLGADDEKDFFLSTYMTHLNLIYEYINKRETSVVLRGFIHDPDCICYWRRSVLSAEAFKRSTDYLEIGHSLRVYILDPRIWEELDEPITADDAVTGLNVAIRESSKRQLPDYYEDYEKNEYVGLISRIYEMKVAVSKLDPEDINKARDPVNELFHLSPLPKSYEYSIPNGAPGIPVMLESLFHALKLQSEPLERLKETNAKAVSLFERLSSSS